MSLNNLPRAFVSASAVLRHHPHGHTPFHRLPFVGRTAWQVPATGGYFGGYATGEAMALSFLHYLRAGNDDLPETRLAQIVTAFAAHLAEADDSGRDSVRGQAIGFCNTLSGWLTRAARQWGDTLAPPRDLVRRANAGLGFDEAAYLASLGEE